MQLKGSSSWFDSVYLVSSVKNPTETWPAKLLRSSPATTTTQSLWMVMDMAVLARFAMLAMVMTKM